MLALSSLFSFFFRTPLHSLLRVVLFVFFDSLHRRPPLVRNLSGRLQFDPTISPIKTSTMITTSNPLFRERDSQSFGRRPTSCHGRFRAFPRSNRIQPTANIANGFATSSTTERIRLAESASRQIALERPVVQVVPANCPEVRLEECSRSDLLEPRFSVPAENLHVVGEVHSHLRKRLLWQAR